MPEGGTFGFEVVLFRADGSAETLRVPSKSGPQLAMTASADVKMTFRFEAEYAGGFNYAYDVVMPIVRLNGEAVPFGRYVITGAERHSDGKTTLWQLSCFDLCQKVRRTKLEQRRYFAAGTPYTSVIGALLQEAGISEYRIEEKGYTLQTDREDWEPGEDHLAIVNGLLAEMNYTSLAMNLDGVLVAGAKKEIEAANITKTYTSRDVHNILIPGGSLAVDAFDRPNVIYYSCENPDLAAPLYAKAENSNARDPFSTANAPRNPAFRSVDNVASQAALQQRANADLYAAMLSAHTVRFETAIAAHGPNEIVALDKDVFTGIVRESEWEMRLGVGEVMRHAGRQAVIEWY